jgi:hypothetical protein
MCKGRHTRVGKTKYFTHKEYCDPNSQFIEHLQDFFNANLIIYGAPPSTPGGSGSSGVVRVHCPLSLESDLMTHSMSPWAQSDLHWAHLSYMILSPLTHPCFSPHACPCPSCLSLICILIPHPHPRPSSTSLSLICILIPHPHPCPSCPYPYVTAI